MRELAVGRDDFRLWAEFARERWGDERVARTRSAKTAPSTPTRARPFAGWEWLISLVVKSDAERLRLPARRRARRRRARGGRAVSRQRLRDARRALRGDGRGGRDRAPPRRALPDGRRAARAESARCRASSCARSAARPPQTDERFVGESEQPAVRIGRARRETAAPLFLFPAVERAPRGRVALAARAALSRAHPRPRGRRAPRTRREQRAHALRDAERGRGRTRRRRCSSDYNVAARVALAGEGGADVEEFAAVVTIGTTLGRLRAAGRGLRRPRRDRSVRRGERLHGRAARAGDGLGDDRVERASASRRRPRSSRTSAI